jgi:hypothetical protein
MITSSHSFRVFAFAYGTAFAVLYVLALAQNLAVLRLMISSNLVARWTREVGFGNVAIGTLTMPTSAQSQGEIGPSILALTFRRSWPVP